MKFNYIIERCKVTGDYMGQIPDMAGAHSVGETLDELKRNMIEVMELLMVGGVPETDSELVGIDEIEVFQHAQDTVSQVSGSDYATCANGFC